MMSFSRLSAVKKDIIFGAARKIFGPKGDQVKENCDVFCDGENQTVLDSSLKFYHTKHETEMTKQLEKAKGFITHQISLEHLQILALHAPEATLVEESK